MRNGIERQEEAWLWIGSRSKLRAFRATSWQSFLVCANRPLRTRSSTLALSWNKDYAGLLKCQ